MNAQQISEKPVRVGAERVDIYDWVRLIATIFVVIGHSAYLKISAAFGGGRLSSS